MEFFVFPLGHVVFYPSISKPFNIFEPRYIQMVKDAVAQNKFIAVGYVDDPNHSYQFLPGEKLSFIREIAGFGIPIILEEREDGGLTIFLQGEGKVKLGVVVDRPTPYIVCQGEMIMENHMVDSQFASDLELIKKMFLNWIDTHVPEKKSREQFVNLIKSPNEVVGCFVSYMVTDQDFQQMILEENNINQKISLIKALILSGETNLFPS